MAHEKSETLQQENGKWINVYGKDLEKAGQVLPILHPQFEKEEYDTEEEAVASAIQRSNLYKPEGMLKDKSSYMPDLEYDADHPRDEAGNILPYSDKKIVTEPEPKSMPVRMTDEEVHEAAEVGEQIKAELKRMLSAMGKDKPKKEEGMLSTAKEDQIAKGYHQMPDGSTMKDSEMEEEYSKDVAKDLDNEGRGLKGYKPPVEKMKEGWQQVEGSNAITVDLSHNYWKTREGYLEANNLYGMTPAWVKEPSLEYNPKTKKYDPIQKEEFVDLAPKIDLSAFA